MPSIYSYITGPKSMAEQGKKDRTIATHAGSHPHDNQGVVNPPDPSGFHRPVPGRSRTCASAIVPKHDAITYGRDGTQTYRAPAAFTALEGCDKAVIVPSRPGGRDHCAALGVLNPRRRLLMVDTAYEPTRGVKARLPRQDGIETTTTTP